MTNFEKFKNMTLDELAKFIDNNGMYDNTPWMNWWDSNYCENCESVKLNYNDCLRCLDVVPFREEDTLECAYCEVYNKCRFFSDLEEEPSMHDIIKMWLEATNED